MTHRYRFLLLVIIAQLLFILNMTLAVHRHGAAQHAAVYVVDVDALSTPPQEIKAPAGSEVLFVRKANIVGTDVTLSQENSDGGKTPMLTVESDSKSLPTGYTLVSKYKLERTGNAAVIVTHRVPMPGAKPYNDTVKITGQ